MSTQERKYRQPSRHIFSTERWLVTGVEHPAEKPFRRAFFCERRALRHAAELAAAGCTVEPVARQELAAHPASSLGGGESWATC